MWIPFKEEEIYEYYLKEPVFEGAKYFSPFRSDGSIPSLSFKYYGNTLRWKDFGFLEVLPQVEKLDATGFVVQMEQLKSRREAEEFIRVNILPNTKKHSGGIKNSKKRESKALPAISIRKNYRAYEKEYWKLIKPDLLIKRNVNPCHSFRYKEDGIDLGSTIDFPSFLYIFNNDPTSYKLYRPTDKENKWKSNNIREVIEGWNVLPERGKILLITSSTKDSLSCESYLDVVTINPTSENNWINIFKNKNEINERFNKIYVWLDADRAGIGNTIKACNETGWTGVYTPIALGLKDQFEIITKDPQILKDIWNITLQCDLDINRSK